MERKISFEAACAKFVHRYTMEHVPQWARAPHNHHRFGAVYYAPHYATDREWYDNTRFPGEIGHVGRRTECTSGWHTWPRGRGFLRRPFLEDRTARVIEEVPA